MKQQILTVGALILTATMGVAGCKIVSETKPPASSAAPASPAAPAAAKTASCAPGVLTRLVGQPESALEVVDLNENTRVLYPNTAATKDRRADRINIDIDARGIITRVWCG